MTDHIHLGSPAQFETKVKASSSRFKRNQHTVAELVSRVRMDEEQIEQGGGEKAIEAQHKKGRLTARERVGLLIDPGTEFFELGSYAAWGMYEEWGGAPSAGVITGLARVQERLVMLIARCQRRHQRIQLVQRGGMDRRIEPQDTLDGSIRLL